MAGPYSGDVLPRRSKRIKRIHNRDESNSNSASEQFMSIATDDMLWEILLRLRHAKHVIRCSVVSKRWFSLIHHPQFTDFYQNRRRIERNNFDLFFRIGGRWPYTSYSMHRLYSEKESETNRLYPNLRSGPQCPDLKLRSSSLDLLVFKHDLKNEIHVCNPLTWQWLKISGPESRCSYTEIVTDHQNFGQYKVVMINDVTTIIDNHTSSRDIHVFCSRSRVWSKSTFSLPYRHFRIHKAISSQGVLYFPFSDRFELIGVLVCSPLESSRFRVVHRPVDGFFGRHWASSKNVFFGVVSERLRVSQLIKRKRVFTLKIWELRYDNESEFESNYSWVLVHNVRLRSSKNTKLFVVAFHPYNGDVIFMLRDTVKICRYHNIGEGDKYEIVGQLPISNLKLSSQQQNEFTTYVRAFTLVHTSCPTPLGPKLW